MATKHRTTAREWGARVKRWQRSGLSAPEFGRREGFEGKQLTWWKWHLSHRGQAAPAAKPVKCEAETTRASAKAAPQRPGRSQRRGQRVRTGVMRFVPVKLPAAAATTVLEIVLGNGRVVRVPTGCDGVWLAEVLAAVAGERPC